MSGLVPTFSSLKTDVCHIVIVTVHLIEIIVRAQDVGILFAILFTIRSKVNKVMLSTFH